MKRNKLIYGMIAATTLFAASCTDFDDYNEAYTDNNPQGTQTLWDNISANGNLSQFAEILKKVNFDKELQNTRTYTVWAPADGSYDVNELLSKYGNDNDLLKKFVNSHVATYNYTLSGEVDANVHALNGKSFALQGNGSNYTYDGVKITNPNLPNLNGILHTIDGYALFLPNIYEHIFDMTGYETDSIKNLFDRYENEYLDKSQSIEGGMDEEGNQTYIDSVMVVSNSLINRDYLNANIIHEDSNFTMLIPNNDAFDKAYNQISKLYNYAAVTQYWEPSKAIPEPPTPSKETTVEGFADSLTIRNIVANTVFNNNGYYNRWLVDPEYVNKSDTLYNTRYRKLSNGPEILSHTVGDVQKMSNGYVRVVDSLAYLPWETYNPEIHVRLSTSNMPLVSGIQGTQPTSRTLYLDEQGNITQSTSGKVRYTARYLDFVPADDYSNPKIYFNVSDVRSTTYNVYVALVPSDTIEGGVQRANKFEVALSYADKNGNLSGSGSKLFTNSFNNWKKSVATSKLVLSPDTIIKPDTILVGQVTFPVSYYGLTNSKAMVRIEGKRSTWNTTEFAKIDNRIRLLGIILRPVEYDEYLKKDE